MDKYTIISLIIAIVGFGAIIIAISKVFKTTCGNNELLDDTGKCITACSGETRRYPGSNICTECPAGSTMVNGACSTNCIKGQEQCGSICFDNKGEVCLNGEVCDKEHVSSFNQSCCPIGTTYKIATSQFSAEVNASSSESSMSIDKLAYLLKKNSKSLNLTSKDTNDLDGLAVLLSPPKSTDKDKNKYEINNTYTLANKDNDNDTVDLWEYMNLSSNLTNIIRSAIGLKTCESCNPICNNGVCCNGDGQSCYNGGNGGCCKGTLQTGRDEKTYCCDGEKWIKETNTCCNNNQIAKGNQCVEKCKDGTTVCTPGNICADVNMIKKDGTSAYSSKCITAKNKCKLGTEITYNPPVITNANSKGYISVCKRNDARDDDPYLTCKNDLISKYSKSGKQGMQNDNCNEDDCWGVFEKDNGISEILYEKKKCTATFDCAFSDGTNTECTTCPVTETKQCCYNNQKYSGLMCENGETCVSSGSKSGSEFRCIKGWVGNNKSGTDFTCIQGGRGVSGATTTKLECVNAHCGTSGSNCCGDGWDFSDGRCWQRQPESTPSCTGKGGIKCGTNHANACGAGWSSHCRRKGIKCMPECRTDNNTPLMGLPPPLSKLPYCMAGKRKNEKWSLLNKETSLPEDGGGNYSNNGLKQTFNRLNPLKESSKCGMSLSMYPSHGI